MRSNKTMFGAARARGSLCCALLLSALAAPVAAQTASGAARLPALMDEAAEIALARSAAPPAISGNADVWVLRRGGHVKVRTGTSGVACIVTRDHPDSLYPICYDAAGARTILPIAIREQQLREQGWDNARVSREIGSAIERGDLQVPERAAVAWMESADQIIYAGPDGPRVGAWKPHLMIHIPGLTPGSFGAAEMPDGDFMIREPGTPLAHLILISRDWAAR